MMQIWLITLGYLVYTGFIYITPEIGIGIPTLLGIREYLFNNKIYIKILMILGYLLSIMNFINPITPGPKFLGDLLPSLFLFLSAFNYMLILIKEEQSVIVEEKLSKRHFNFGIILFAVAFLHFLLPKWVIF